MEVHNEASLSSGLNSKKAMYHQYMISRAFIPPWSLVMRDRKLSDQTLPVKAAGTLVSPSQQTQQSYNLATRKSRKLPHRSGKLHRQECSCSSPISQSSHDAKSEYNCSRHTGEHPSHAPASPTLLPSQALASPIALRKRIRPIPIGGA
jgi:hypothetical protein